MYVIIPTLIFIFFALILFILDKVNSSSKNKIFRNNNVPGDIDVILVLGAGIKDDGTPSNVLRSRLETAILISSSIKDCKIILSGDYRDSKYNEVSVMKKFILENSGINKTNIYLDYFGYSTYESIYIAKEVFGIKKMIIITNGYHLPRALYIAERLNIVSFGIPSDIKNSQDIDLYIIREKVAQVKDFIYVNILKPKPRYLKSKIKNK